MHFGAEGAFFVLYPIKSGSSELMPDYPFQQIVKAAFSGSDLENDVGQFLLRVFELYPIKRKEYEHCVRADAFVPVDKRMVFDESITQAGRLLLNGREGLDIAEGPERRIQRGLKQALVAKACTPPVSAMSSSCSAMICSLDSTIIRQSPHTPCGSWR